MMRSSRVADSLAVQVTGIDQQDGKWRVRYTPKKGDQAGQELSSSGLDAVVLADTLLTQTGVIASLC